MRKPTYISPSALSCYESNPVEYYLRYLSDNKPPRDPQTLPMSAGSAFDAYVKSYLHFNLFGAGHADADRFRLRPLFEAQVESSLWDQAWPVGAYLFGVYKRSGALADLMLQMNGAADEPRFEFSVEGLIGRSSGSGVPLLGKPDVRFVTAKGVHVIYDFKVNGFYGKSNTSPTPGYLRLLDGATGAFLGCHRDCMVQRINGLDVNIGSYFENVDASWAAQLATYAWLMGEDVGAETIIGIHQLACNGLKRVAGDYPTVRVAVHASRISSGFQIALLGRYQRLWSIINSSPFWYFTDLSLSESVAKCSELDAIGSLSNSVDPQLAAMASWSRR